MVEFGGQLRSAREMKGLTQKALADQLYVTRQTVSRWECGERYPDIITLKKLSQILSVSLDDLLSGKEMSKVAEKNPVVENKAINNFTSVLYSFVVLPVFIQLAKFVALIYFKAYDRFGGSPLTLSSIVYNLEQIVLIIIFSYGIYNAVKDTLTPKKIGIILFIFFIAHLLFTGGLKIFYQVPNYVEMIKHAMDPDGEKYGVAVNNVGSYYKTIIISIFRILWRYVIPCILGAIASFFFFIREGKRKLWVNMLTIASGLRILDTISSFIKCFKLEKFYTINNSLATLEGVVADANQLIVDFVLGIALSVLIIYQTYTLYRKRKTAMDLDGEEQLKEAPAQ